MTPGETVFIIKKYLYVKYVIVKIEGYICTFFLNIFLNKFQSNLNKQLFVRLGLGLGLVRVNVVIVLIVIFSNRRMMSLSMFRYVIVNRDVISR